MKVKEFHNTYIRLANARSNRSAVSKILLLEVPSNHSASFTKRVTDKDSSQVIGYIR